MTLLTFIRLLLYLWCNVSYGGCYLSEKPVELHALGGGVAALDQPRPPVHVHQALVIIVVDGGAEHAHVELLRAAVIHVLKRHRNKTHVCEPMCC